MQKINVSQGKTKMDKTVRRRVPCTCPLISLYRKRSVDDAMPLLFEKKKKVMKKQRKSKKRVDGKKGPLAPRSGVGNPA
jgi:hypothetical protein